MNILVGADDKYIKPCATTLLSLKKTSRTPNNIYFMMWEGSEISNDNIKIIKNSLKKDDTFNIIKLPYIEQIKCIDCGRFGASILMRVVALFFLPTNIDKILYIDSDIIFKKNIIDFYNNNENCVYAIREKNAFADKLCFQYGITDNFYINSGFVLFNLNLIRKIYTRDSYFKKIEILSKYKFVNPDQDLLNILFINKKGTPTNPNYIHLTNYKLIKNKGKIYGIHYILKPKPWELEYKNIKLGLLYWKFAKHIFGAKECFMHYKIFFLHIFEAIKHRFTN